MHLWNAALDPRWSCLLNLGHSLGTRAGTDLHCQNLTLLYAVKGKESKAGWFRPRSAPVCRHGSQFKIKVRTLELSAACAAYPLRSSTPLGLEQHHNLCRGSQIKKNAFNYSLSVYHGNNLQLWCLITYRAFFLWWAKLNWMPEWLQVTQ